MKNPSSLPPKKLLYADIYMLYELINLKKNEKKLIRKYCMLFSKWKNWNESTKMSKKLLFDAVICTINGFLSNKKHFKIA